MDAKITLALIAICMILFSGCINIPEESTLKISNTEIRIGDSPIEDFKHVNLTISNVTLYGAKTGWIHIPLNTTTIDLIYLHNNNLTTALGTGKLEIGNYSQLLLTISNATGITNDGKMIYFNISSNSLHIQHMFNFYEGDNIISIDINLNKSIYEYGNGELYKLLPVISELNVSYANGTTIRFRNRERIINYRDGTQITLQDQNSLENMIGNRKPTIDIAVDGKRGNTFQYKINQSITFNASGTIDLDDDVISYTWQFGDNTSENGKIATHSYSHEGTYQIQLKVSDSQLEEVMTLTIIIIKSENQGNNSNNAPL